MILVTAAPRSRADATAQRWSSSAIVLWLFTPSSALQATAYYAGMKKRESLKNRNAASGLVCISERPWI